MARLIFILIILGCSCNQKYPNSLELENYKVSDPLKLPNPEELTGNNSIEGKNSLGKVIIYSDKYIWNNKSFKSFETLEKSLQKELLKQYNNPRIYMVPKEPDETENLVKIMEFCINNRINGILISPNKQNKIDEKN